MITAILDYAEYDVSPVLNERLESAWPFIKQKIDRDAETYRKKCARAAKSAKSRWEKKASTG